MRRNDWLAELHADGDWRHHLVDWLQRHDSYLPVSMSQFVATMGRSRREPAPRQLALLISLRGGTEAVMRFERILDDTENRPTLDDFPDEAPLNQRIRHALRYMN